MLDRQTVIGINDYSCPRYGKSSLLAVLLLLASMTCVATGKEDVVIASFDNPDSTKDWFSVNDGVMGGVSKGAFERTGSNTLVFSGDLSLKNNGGFASIRSTPADLNLAGALGIRVKARGDGRKYWVNLHTTGQFRASSYRAFLETTAGKFTETFIPIADFKLQAFGRQLPGGPVDPTAISAVGFTIADKKEGPFRFELASITAVFDDEKAASKASAGTVVDVATQAGMFETLLAAVVAADLAGALSGDGPFTVFAPTDEAFSKLPEGTVESLIKPENKAQLVSILKHHVIAGRVTLAEALAAGEGKTLEGTTLVAQFEGGRVRIGAATLLQADIQASNGIIHVIDQVLLPPKQEVEVRSPAALIERAIELGVPLFNRGNEAACAAVYEITCEALLATPAVAEDSRKDISEALTAMRGAKTDHDKAWILRRAMDRTLSRGFK